MRGFNNKLAFRTEIEDVYRAFRINSEELFEVTRALEVVERHKGLFGVAYVRPLRRTARLLSADREILLLISTFRDQQARTIQLATDLIDDAEGRLENTIAIIIHRDHDGNTKLKNWGRELGLSVIPLCTKSDAPLPRGRELESILFYEFYSHDPFDVSGPVYEDGQFYGRRTEAQDLARHLQKGQVRSALGIRKIGKTSVINRVLFVAEDFHRCYSVMVDCSRDAVWTMSSAQLIAAISNAIALAHSQEDCHAEVAECRDDLSIADAYERLSNMVKQSTTPVIIFFDEVDYITPSSPTNPGWWREHFNPFWRNLRAIYQEAPRSKSVLSILVSGVSSKWFRVEAIDGVENAALAFVPEEYLSPIPSGAAVAMVQDIARVAGLILNTDSARLITDACSNIPFWIRKAGSYVHRKAEIGSRPYDPGKSFVSSMLQEFIQSEGAAVAGVALSHLFRVYPELEPVAIACYERQTTGQPSYLLRILERYGVSTYHPKDRDWVISGHMMKVGIRSHLEQRAGEIPHPIPEQDSRLRFESIDEWAEEIAAIGALRNKLERRMRSMVLNFIRFDAMSNKPKGSAHERVIKCVEVNRRTSMQHLTLDDVFEKLNWAELVALVEREWVLFQSMFGDKAKFRTHCDIINRRYDAHAKDADRADVAEYRRSVNWLEGALGKA